MRLSSGDKPGIPTDCEPLRFEKSGLDSYGEEMVERTVVNEISCSTLECSWKKRITHFFIIAGPGCMAMLADTDAGSIVTAAQSGALWGYRLLWLQLLLIPILYFVQELTVRLGFASGKGQGSLIRMLPLMFWFYSSCPFAFFLSTWP
jgi:hypothetical protein